MTKTSIERQLRNRVLGELMPEDLFRAAVRKAINDTLDTYFDKCGIDEPRTGSIGAVAEVAADWISHTLEAENMKRYQDESENRALED